MNVSMDLSSSPLLDAIMPQPDDQRRFLILLGYIKASTDQIVTVYPELDLSTYIEIPRGEIVWAEKAVPGLVSSPTKLVINAATPVKRITTTGRKVEVGFLSGMIASSCLPTSVAGVSINVSVDKDLTPEHPQCPGQSGGATSKGTGGASSNCKLTGVCISDGMTL